MNGLIKKIANIFPVTTTKAVYIDGTNKTLQQAIDNGEIGGGTTTTVSTSGRGYVQFHIRGGVIYVQLVEESNSNPTRIRYFFPTEDYDRLRRCFVWKPNGSITSIDIPDGELAENEALIYNFDTNTLRVGSGTWGNVGCANNEVILLYNSAAIIGALAPYVKTFGQNFIPTRDVLGEVISPGGGVTQGLFIIDDYMYFWSHSSDDKTTTLGGYATFALDNVQVSTHGGKHNLGHMNAPSYSHSKDMMIVGNGSKIYDQSALPMEGWIFPNFKAIMEANPANLVFDDLNKVVLDLSQFQGEFKAQLCWGEDETDFVYLITSDHRVIRKLQLGKGTNNLGNGNMITAAEEDYNGTYSIIGEWRTEVTDLVGGIKYYNGYLYSAVKGDKGIRRMTLCSNGYIHNEYFGVIHIAGTMQGIDIKDGYMYAYTDGAGFKIDMNKFN